MYNSVKEPVNQEHFTLKMFGLLMLFCKLCLRIGEEKSDEQGEPLFCGKDVARALGYKNPEKALRVHIEDDDKVVNKMDTTYGIKPTTFINESGLYSLILSC